VNEDFSICVLLCSFYAVFCRAFFVLFTTFVLLLPSGVTKIDGLIDNYVFFRAFTEYMYKYILLGVYDFFHMHSLTTFISFIVCKRINSSDVCMPKG